MDRSRRRLFQGAGYSQCRIDGRPRYVTDFELDLALRVGRELGGPRQIVALALKTAYLCVRRSVEVRALAREQITAVGISWTSAKRQKSQFAQHGLIEWSAELRSVINEALAVQQSRSEELIVTRRAHCAPERDGFAAERWVMQLELERRLDDDPVGALFPARGIRAHDPHRRDAVWRSWGCVCHWDASFAQKVPQ